MFGESNQKSLSNKVRVTINTTNLIKKMIRVISLFPSLEEKAKRFTRKLIRLKKGVENRVIEVKRRPQSLVYRGREMVSPHQNQEQTKGLLRGI
jgi:hypothetical protein